MSRYSAKLLGFGDNVVDIYDHLKTMYPDISEMMTEQS